MKFSPNIQY